MNECFPSGSRTKLFLLGSILLLTLQAHAQFTLDREAMGPTSRKTGLVISEIMYHPATVPAFTNLNLQFIELYNSNPWEEDISGFSISGSVQFTIPSETILHAGEFIVIAREPDNLKLQSSITNVLGPWIGALTNALPVTSGTVQLLNPLGAVFLEVNYDGNLPWPPAADGKGHSLVLGRPSFGQDNARAWIASDVIGGSPGGADPVGVEPLAGVYINEYLAHTDLPLRDFIELYNHNNFAVDLSGAYLTDHPDTNRF
ncbi:MAG TPA: lamin tail domain-containing protein, partial [Verrucomicrobiae bacterium]|nr:lamin tail domain-containing protein [Verrucomicrobiae bacterium]